MLNLENYGEIFHNHRNCQEIRNDGTCRMTRHEKHFYKKDVKTQSAIIYITYFMQKNIVLRRPNRDSKIGQSFSMKYELAGFCF